MSFLDVFEGVEYESAIIPKLTRVMGISELVCESSIIGETLPTVLAIRKPNSVKSFIKLICRYVKFQLTVPSSNGIGFRDINVCSKILGTLSQI